jgi:hypothetical protein
MKNLSEFIGPLDTPEMQVRVVGKSGETVQAWTAPRGFQLERFVDHMHPENEFMLYSIYHLTPEGDKMLETNISVWQNHGVECVYVGLQKYENVKVTL